MPFYLDKVAKDLTDSTYFDNPITVSVYIVLILMIIIYFNFPKSENNQNFGLTIFRTGIYSFFPTVLILFLHYKHLNDEFENKSESKITNNLVNYTTGKNLDPGLLNLHPDQT